MSRARLGPDTYDAAWAAGHTLSVEALIEEIDDMLI
jgi:hypothetical protein